ncbi:hypothetical protein [Maribacter sp. 4G9]|uniref:hypothetical protein n=1 Tax=Maribacter sp. 4G9 TaxID=1889777 RepID=UPI000C1586C5|nr:hypothetical protein [Maribacter sp. 4G9]PIB38692.1 hypothetical protein BFP75_15585 [Maribacter sp. 4G9]
MEIEMILMGAKEILFIANKHRAIDITRYFCTSMSSLKERKQKKRRVYNLVIVVSLIIVIATALLVNAE